ncbi:hypothetical protein BK004_03460 [bacterium CG10_46_32]|nr:MAG: hypothetical protein BK004_03460 [bacterium CG10_46_32]PIR55938.1 MAG: hypothetical protein COU73_03490 [Parcubacteria group bacterium CG10_big_fil_rev_8_21_14_0_10_46_32]
MENRQLTDEQPNEAEGHAIVHEPRYWLITALAVVATALLVGGGMWWWMYGKLEAQRKELEQKVVELKGQIDEEDRIIAPDNFVEAVEIDEEDRVITSNDFVEPVELVNPVDVVIQGWEFYENKDLGFSLWHPPDWSIFERSLLSPQVGLSSPEFMAAQENTPPGTELAGDNLTIFYYKTVDDYLSSNAEGVSRIEDLNSHYAYRELQPILFNGIEAWTVVEGGIADFYQILIPVSGHLYKLLFTGKNFYSNLTEIEQGIVSSVKFIN